MKKILNEYDDTKRMLNKLRALNESSKRSINEQEEAQDNDVDVINDVNVKMHSTDQLDLKLTDDQRQQVSGLIDTFREQVSELANLEPGFTFAPNQIRLDGVIGNYDIKFVLIAGEQAGVFINAQMLKIDDEVLNIIKSILDYYPQFNDAMDVMIRDRNNN